MAIVNNSIGCGLFDKCYSLSDTSEIKCTIESTGNKCNGKFLGGQHVYKFLITECIFMLTSVCYDPVSFGYKIITELLYC